MGYLLLSPICFRMKLHLYTWLTFVYTISLTRPLELNIVTESATSKYGDAKEKDSLKG